MGSGQWIQLSWEEALREEVADWEREAGAGNQAEEEEEETEAPQGTGAPVSHSLQDPSSPTAGPSPLDPGGLGGHPESTAAIAAVQVRQAEPDCGSSSRMVLRDRRQPYVFPRSCGGRMSCVFLVFIPMFAAIAFAGLWMYKCKQVILPYSVQEFPSHVNHQRERRMWNRLHW